MSDSTQAFVSLLPNGAIEIDDAKSLTSEGIDYIDQYCCPQAEPYSVYIPCAIPSMPISSSALLNASSGVEPSRDRWSCSSVRVRRFISGSRQELSHRYTRVAVTSYSKRSSLQPLYIQTSIRSRRAGTSVFTARERNRHSIGFRIYFTAGCVRCGSERP